MYSESSPIRMAPQRSGLAALLAVLLCVAPVTSTSGEGARQRMSLDAVLRAYLDGDHDVIRRTFVRSIDIQNQLRLHRPRELDRWLGPWNRAKAMLLLEFAQVSARVAPQYVSVIAGAGRRYLAAARSAELASDHGDFVRVWQRATVGLLLAVSDPARVEEHVADLERDGRFLLARGVAQERRCWASRPALEHQASQIDALLESAGVRVPDDLGGPFRSRREAALAEYSACLKEALSRFEAAAATEDAAAEARVRGGWVLIQDGRPAEAIEWLSGAQPRDDRDLEYWHALFRGRAFDAAGRFEDAVLAYRSALVIHPRAQSAGLGLTIALMHLDRQAEADDVARVVREGESLSPDPWLHYPYGDERFTRRWIDSLRTIR